MVSHFIEKHRVFVKICSLCLIGIFSIVTCLVATGVTYGFKVEYEGQVIATVRDESIFNDAKTLAAENVNSNNAKTAIAKPVFKGTLTVADRLDDAVQVADAIIENTEEIVKASAVMVNGEMIACVETGDLDAYLSECLTRFDTEGAENVSEFVDDVVVTKGLYLLSDIDTLMIAKRIIDTIPVKTVSTVSINESVGYNTVTEKTDEQLVGYSAVTTKGVNGIAQRTELVVKINGEETERTVTSEAVVAAPVDEVILVGTAKTKATASEMASASSAGFIFPIASGWKLSAYYGDGRNHKGIDLAAPKGTNIYAAKGGTVISSGFDGGYGYCVVIDHGNGLQTAYAHASQLYVSKGDVVAQGDTIAGVGSTGNSSGNHLHFEVIVNGGKVNPAPYIGIK